MTDAILIGRAFRRCGLCEHTEPSIDGDSAKVTCKGAPPNNVALPARDGILIQAFWPLVQKDATACAVFKPKPVTAEKATATQ